MAHLKGNIQFTGSIEGMVAYKLNGKIVLRRKPDISRKKIMQAPSYAGTRRQLSEFGAVSQYGKLFRQGLGKVYMQGSDSYAYQRIAKTFSQVKDLDKQSKLGERNVSEGLLTPESKGILGKLVFDEKETVFTFLPKEIEVDFEEKRIVLKRDIVLPWPKKADKAVLTGYFLQLDMKQKKALLTATEAIEVKRDKENKVTLTTSTAAEKSNGDQYALMTIAFYKSKELLNKGGRNLLIILDAKSSLS